MKRFWVHVVTGLTAICGAAVLGPACAHNDSSFFLRGVLAPPQSASSSGCQFTNDPTQAEESDGVFDVGVAGEYNAVFLAGNQIITQGNMLQLQTETSRIEIQGAVVRIVDLTTGEELANYTDPESGFIDPANGTTPGYGAVGFVLVDPTTAERLSGTIPPFGFGALGPFESRPLVSYVKAFGYTIGGDYVESNTFGFKITACNGCLVEYTSLTPTPFCDPAVAPSTTGGALCFVGEDVPFDCHRCIGQPICQCGLDTCP